MLLHLEPFFTIAIYVHNGRKNVISSYICRVSASSMYVASNLGSTYHVFFIHICLGKPTLRTSYTAAFFMFTQAGKMTFVDAYVVFLLVVCILRLPNQRSGLKSKQLIRLNAINP